jgi:hypothetical protein
MFADREFSEAWEAEISDLIESDEIIDADDPGSNATDEPHPPGWIDQTDRLSSLWGDDGNERGWVREAPDGEWNWRAYTVPITKGRSRTRGGAKRAVTIALK